MRLVLLDSSRVMLRGLIFELMRFVYMVIRFIARSWSRLWAGVMVSMTKTEEMIA